MSDRFKRITLLSIAQITNSAVGILLLPYLARSFEVEQYGTYSQVLLVSTLLSTLLGFGLGSLIVYLLTSKQTAEGRGTAFRTAFILASGGGAIAALVMTLGAPLLSILLQNPAVRPLLPFYALAPLFSMLTGVCSSALVFYGKTKSLSAISVGYNLLRYAALFTGIQLGVSFEFLFLFLLATDFMGMLLFAIALPHEVRTGSFSLSDTTEILRKGIALSGATLLGVIMLNVDGVIVSNMLGPSTFAIYKNGAFEVPFFSALYGAIATVTFPEIAAMVKDQRLKELVKLKQDLLLNVALVVYPVLVFLLLNASEFIVLYLSDRYILSSTVFWIFNLTLLLRITDYADVLLAFGKSGFILRTYAVLVLINIPLNIVLIRLMGAEGAALSTVLSIFLLSLIQARKTNQLLGASIFDKRVFLQLFLYLISTGSIALATSFLLRSVANPWIRMSAMFLIFVTLTIILFHRIGWIKPGMIKSVLRGRSHA